MKESGISPTKTELDEAIEQIIAMEESADEQRKGDKMEGDRLKAEEMRRTAMETDIRENTEEKVRGGAEKSRKTAEISSMLMKRHYPDLGSAY